MNDGVDTLKGDDELTPFRNIMNEWYARDTSKKIRSAEHIPIPAYHMQQMGTGLWKTREIKDPYNWGSSTIVHIIENPMYLGHTCNFKTRKHFKDKKSHYVDQDQWTIIENTHEAIVDKTTFDKRAAPSQEYPALS